MNELQKSAKRFRFSAVGTIPIADSTDFFRFNRTKIKLSLPAYNVMVLPWLKTPDFPDSTQALDEPNGLLAAGGQLTMDWLLAAYQRGIFPWFSEDDPILWWSPSPRLVFYPNQLHISRSLRKVLKKGEFSVTVNHAFSTVVTYCATVKRNQQDSDGTWITQEMHEAYIMLHKAGYAHSLEVWQKDELMGGLYGVALGKIFFGESMFSRMRNGSKIAISHLAEWLRQWHYKLIDCQVTNNHLLSLGAVEISRQAFEKIVTQYGGDADVNNTITAKEENQKKKEWIAQEITYPRTHWQIE